ncbi:MAG: hypothetical protein COB76_01755 [Alphaproteobacteria bacterium]|nr:MAG: hypothetical protein COB76_01755 [Alphaproteobacteria bacterium]
MKITNQLSEYFLNKSIDYSIETSQKDRSGFWDMVTVRSYIGLSCIFNGTFDFEAALVPRNFRERWTENVKKRSNDVLKNSTRNERLSFMICGDFFENASPEFQKNESYKMSREGAVRVFLEATLCDFLDAGLCRRDAVEAVLKIDVCAPDGDGIPLHPVQKIA